MRSGPCARSCRDQRRVRSRTIDLSHASGRAGVLSMLKSTETGAMSKPIPDKAEVTLEYQDKLYIGTFEQAARFDAHLDETGISLELDRAGEAGMRKSVRMHFH